MDTFKKDLEKIKFIGEAEGIFKGILLNESCTAHEAQVIVAWLDKVEKHFKVIK